MPTLGQLEGQIALVTGGGSGIGRAVVERYIAEGARVVVVDLAPERLAALADAHGDRVVGVEADVTSVAGNQAAVQAALEHFGRLDVFVPNAGVWDSFTDLIDIPVDRLDAAYERVFDVNVRAVILGCRAAVPALAETRGCIVMTLSNSSFHPDGGGVLYVTSKHALLGTMRQLAHELAPAVRVNGVAPGATRTDLQTPGEVLGDGPMEESADPEAQEAEQDAAVEAQTPLGLHADPTWHTGAFVLLASRSESRLMTGAVLETDAGLGIRGLRRVRGGDDLLARVRAGGPAGS